jgi:hypothetical protein
MMMSENQSSLSQVHAKALWVLTNPCSELSLSWPTGQERGGGFPPYTGLVIGRRGRIRRVKQTHNGSQMGFTPPSGLFMH